jgi:hypothetical protein
MSRKKQSIEIVLHKPTDISEVYNAPQVTDFWKEMILAKVRACSLTQQDYLRLLEKDFGNH